MRSRNIDVINPLTGELLEPRSDFYLSGGALCDAGGSVAEAVASITRNWTSR